MKHLSRMLLYVVLVGGVPFAAYAKRVPPPAVAPVTANGIQYSADGDGRHGYIVATDVASRKELWRIKLFSVHIRFWVEEDNQWVYLTNLKLKDNSLLARDEKGRCYSVDVGTKQHKEHPCGDEFAAPTN